ncbi:MAG: ATP-binding protein [Candidatus Woesearchaeota archaeon]
MSRKQRFVEEIERKVFRTIKDYKLIDKNDHVLIALSGGKDSMSLLEILNEKFNVEAIFIDLGIEDFSSNSRERIINYCKEKSVKLKILNLKEEIGFSIQEIVPTLKELGLNACNSCGIIKRYVLNRNAKGYEKLVTGHNMDDEISSIFMNIFKANIRANASLGPKTGIFSNEKFVQRIKPLYFCTNEEMKKYALLKGILFFEEKCPLREGAFRVFVSEELKNLFRSNEKFRNAKQRIIKSYLNYLKPWSLEIFKNKKLEMNYCSECGEPSSKQVCTVCKTIKMIKENYSKTLSANKQVKNK